MVIIEDKIKAIGSWTEYWQTGASVSFIAGPEMQARLVSLWGEFVDGLNDGGRILDLATGNGVVARNCATRARERNILLHIDAVDAADIDPKKCVADQQQLFSQVCFQGGIQIESLPFADCIFDAVVSQFGFEYAEENSAITEILRVLAPGGQLQLIVHAHEGAVSQDINNRLTRLNSALADDGPVGLVLALARAAEAGDTKTLKRKLKHLPAAAELTQSFINNPLPDDSALFYSTEFLRLWARRKDYWPLDMRRSAEQGWSTANGVANRQAQMLGAARSDNDIQRISKRFEAAGLVIDAAEKLHDHRRNIQVAWVVKARKT